MANPSDSLLHCLGGPATSFSLTFTSIPLSVVADSRSEKLIQAETRGERLK